MSSEIPSASTFNAEDHHTVDDEAYEPTYAEAFPPLPAQEQEPALPTNSAPPPVDKSKPGQWTKKLSLRSSMVTQVFTVPLEERRFKDLNEQSRFGDQSEQAKICGEIMSKTGVAIEMSLSKDESLTVVITGKVEQVMRARKMVVQQLQTQARHVIAIPKEHHRFLLGAKGKKLIDLELATATKITIPRSEEKSDQVIITGSKEGIEKARYEIQHISDEQAKLAFERLPIEKIYHPFICGPDNTALKSLQESTGARISVPPPSVQKDEVVISGEKDGVARAKIHIMRIYEEKKRKCQTVSVEVRKSQHKYVIGPRGTNLNEILTDCGVSVEVPPLESNSETITLRGEQDKLGPALTMVYSKANSVLISEVQAPSWLHRYIIGRKGENVRKITQDLAKVHIEFTDGQDKIVVEGPPEEVEQAQKALEDITKDLKARMDFAEIDVEQKYHRHIIGRQGANVTRIKSETGCAIKIPSDTMQSNIIRIEGDPKGVQKAKQELMDMVQKMENEKSRDIIIEQRFHKTIIGAGGEKIKEIRDKFNQVQVTFPDSSKKSDIVTLRGPKNDVDRCCKYMAEYQKELVVSNYKADVHIFKKFHKNIIGKGGVNIKKIRDETDTKIDLPAENSDSDVIVVTGKKANVEQAKAKIEAMQKELANIKEATVDIPHKFHNSIIGAKGRLIRSIMDECGGVLIRFPPESQKSDKVTIRGPKDDVDKAKTQLQELASEREVSSFTLEIHAKPEYHKFLIGRNGVNIRKVRDDTGARVVFPSRDDTDQELITIIGKKQAVEEAKKILEASIKNLENITEAEMSVDSKFHRHFVARRGEVLRRVAEDFGGVTVSFPRSGVKSDKVVLKGAKDCVEGAKQRISEIVADLESQVTMDCVIEQKYHRTVMGAKGCKVQDITREHEVGIKFPDRPTPQTENSTPVQNGDAEGNGLSEGEEVVKKRQDVIVITGKKENCEAAKAALLALVPITKEMDVPYDMHKYIIGQKGREIRRMMEENDVSISVPPNDQKIDTIKITGAPANVDKAIVAMNLKVEDIEKEEEEKKARNFVVQIDVDPKYHPKIIGRGGKVVSEIRTQYDVNIKFPQRDAAEQNIIEIVGKEEHAEQAKAHILKLVQELLDQTSEDVVIDHRVHSRLIGARGRGVRKLMDDFHVDIRFPRSDSDQPDVVVISGNEENIWDCKHHLLCMEEEYMQDIKDTADMEQYMHPPSRGGGGDGRGRKPKGFVVRDAPWSGGAAAPDASNVEEFPEFGSTVQKNSAPVKWGPWRK